MLCFNLGLSEKHHTFRHKILQLALTCTPAMLTFNMRFSVLLTLNTHNVLFIVRKRLVVMKGYVPACSSAAWSYVTWKKWRLLVLILWTMSVLSCSYFYYPLRPECWFCCAAHRKTEQYENKHVSCESPALLLFECSSTKAIYENQKFKI